MKSRNNKRKSAVIKLFIYVSVLFWANNAIDTMRDMTPEEFWGQFKSHTIVIENVQAKTDEVQAEAQTVPMVWEKGEFTAYTASRDENDATPDIAANGKKVFLGGIACPGRYEFGQKVEVRGHGVYTCNDRMNIRYRNSNHFDIFHTTKAEAFKFGRQQIEFRAL